MMEGNDSETAEEAVYKIALKTFIHVYENRELYHVILNSRVPDFNLDRFCTLALQAFKDSKQFVPDISRSDIDIDFYYYNATHQFIRYICYWDSINYSSTPEYMAEQVAKMVNLAKPGSVLVANEEEHNKIL